MVTVAVAQPLLDLLGRNASFFVAHDARAVHVVGTAVALTVLLPLVLAGVVLLLSRLTGAAAVTLHAVLLWVLAALLALVAFKLSGVTAGLPGPVVVGLAVVIGVVAPLGYWRSRVARRAAMAAAVAAPVAALLFLFASPARALVLPAPAPVAIQGLGPDAPPVVIAVFDELPVASLLGKDRRVDAEAFPSFARLQDTSTFFRNTTSVHGQTSDAVPAALTGRYPAADKLPLAADHPDNLFALLSQAYDTHAVEPMTELCPPGECTRGDEDAAAVATLARDLAVVGSHLVLPPDMAESLPPIDQGWRDFRTAAEAQGKEMAVRDRFRAVRAESPAVSFEEFVDDIAASERPALHFGHVLLPHSPWRYAADGREYDQTTERPGVELGRWVADEWNVAQGYQRHLVQLQLSDRLLGRLLDRLEDQGMYDDAVVVVFADHGASFTPETSLRVIEPATFPEIAAVPLFVKRPGQAEGSVSDHPVETVDILPTILDVLGVDPPEGIDGRSAFDTSDPREQTFFFGPTGRLVFDADPSDVWPVVDRKLRIFGASDAVEFPFGMAPPDAEQLLGRTVPMGDAGTGEVIALVENPQLYESVDPDEPTVPAMVSGLLIHGPGQRPVVAVSVNGRIMAVAKADAPDAEGHRFRALVPPDSLRPGSNSIELFLVGPDATLTAITMSPPIGADGP